MGVRQSLAALAVLALAGPSALAQTAAPGEETPAAPVPYKAVAKPAAKPVSSAAVDPDDNASDQAPAAVKPPAKRVKRNAAILQALDKVTAETLRFQAEVNQPVRYKDLVFTVHACEENASDELQPGAFAHIEIDSQPKPPPGQAPPPARQLFQGWMFSNAPSAHPFEHPVYDAWLIACKTAAPGS